MLTTLVDHYQFRPVAANCDLSVARACWCSNLSQFAVVRCKCRNLLILCGRGTLNQRVPGSSPGRLTTYSQALSCLSSVLWWGLNHFGERHVCHQARSESAKLHGLLDHCTENL